MNVLLRSCLFALLALASLPASATPVEAYGSLPKYDEVSLSPSGARIALVQTEGSQRVIAIVSLTDGKPIGGARVGEEKLRGIQWADEDHLLIFRSVTSKIPQLMLDKGEFMNMLSFDVRTGKTTSLPLTGKGDNLLDTVNAEPMIRRIDGHTVLFFVCYSVKLDRSMGAVVRVLVRYDLDSGAQRLVRTGTRTTSDLFVDDAGHVNAVVDYDVKAQEWKLSALIGEDMHTVLTGSSPIEIPSIAGFGADANTVLVRMLQDDRQVFRALNVSTGALTAEGVLPSESTPMFDPYSNRLMGHSGVADSRQFHFDDASRQGVWDQVTKLFPG
jgi:hypothetical protein